MKQNSQKRTVLIHLQTRGSITPFEAWERYNITRLSAIIYRLRLDGLDISTVINEANNGAKYARYYLNDGAV